MPFSEPELRTFADLIAVHYTRPRIEVTSVPQPPRQRKVVDTIQTERKVVDSIEVDDGPTPAWLLAAGGGAALAILAGVVMKGWAVALLLLTGAGIAAWYFATHSRRFRVEERITTQLIETPVERTIEEPAPPLMTERTIPNTTRVTAVGTVLLDFLAVPIEKGAAILDAHRLGRAIEVAEPSPTNPERIWELIGAIDSAVASVPAILEGEPADFTLPDSDSITEPVRLRGEERALKDLYDELRTVLADSARTVFRLQVLPSESPFAPLLRRRLRPGEQRSELEEGRRLLAHIHGHSGHALDRALRQATRRWALRQAVVDAARHVSLRGGIAPACQELGQIFHYSAFHFYCPPCNAELQRELLTRDYHVHTGKSHTGVQYSLNTRCNWDEDRRSWVCPTCEQVASTPIPVHRMLAEVFLPSFDRLMEENKNARLSIYADARSRELDYTNGMHTETEQLFLQNRHAVEQLEYEMKRIEAELYGEEEAVRSLLKVMDSYQLKQSAALGNVLAQQQSILANIARDQVDIRQELNALYEGERSRALAAMKACSRAKRIEDEQRDAVYRELMERQLEAAVVTAGNTTQMVGQLEVIRGHTGRTAEASESTAANTGRIAQHSETIAAHTGTIAEHTGAIAEHTGTIAEHTGTIAEHTETIAGNTTSMVSQLGHVVDNTERTANGTERTAAGVDRLVDLGSEANSQRRAGNAISAAMAKKAGVKRGASIFSPVRGARHLGAQVISTITMEDDVARAGRENEALR